MKKVEEFLIHNTVTSIDIIEDQVSISFVDGCRLNLFNPVIIHQADSFVGRKVTSVEFHDEYLLLVFDFRVEVMMSLKDADYSGPEALSFRSGSGEIIVL